MKTNILHDAIVVAMLSAGAGMAGAATAAEPPTAAAQDGASQAATQASFDFAIPAGDLRTALNLFSSQTGLEVLYPADELAGKQGRALHGRMQWPDALATLLQGSGFGYRHAADGSVVIAHMAALPSRGATALEAVVVTGTRIRGGESASPVITIGSEDIREAGFTDLGEVVRSITQNFSGGQNPGVAGGATTGAAGIANQNLTGGSSLNLRGLGPDATLTLLNGHRMSYGGFVQAVDISAIPVEAVERVEILPDGASALYGSDAVGGVGNVVLQRDYDGVSTGVRYGEATGGGMQTQEVTATAGTVWRSGGLIATYKGTSTDPIFARQREYTQQMADPSTLYAGSSLRSGLFSMHQSLGDAVEFSLDALRTDREQTQYPYNTNLLSYYNILTQDSEATLIAPSLDIWLPRDWSVRIGGGWGRDRVISRQTRVSHADGSLNPRSDDCYCNNLASWEISAEGPLFALAGGEARLAAGAGYRRTEFAQEQHLTDTIAIQGSESSRFAYAELNLPFAGPDAGRPWMQRFELNVAARSERYDSFGAVTTPKVGLIYGPSPAMTLKASWGKSFKAPTLFQRYWAQQALLRYASEFGGPSYSQDQTVLMIGGGNPGLEPERATTRSVSLMLHPEALSALDAELTWFDIDYTDRVVQPLTDLNMALQNPGYARFIDNTPTEVEQTALLESAGMFYNLVGMPYDPTKVVAIVYSNYANVARQRIKGFDLSASYRLNLGPGELALRGSASWLDSSQQATPAEDFHDLSGVRFGPVKFRSRVGAAWTGGGLTVSGFVNHTDGVVGPSAEGGKEQSASFTTFDATVRCQTGLGVGLWSGLEFALAAQNLFDRDPPAYTPTNPSFPPYDSTNYSAIGRFVSVSITKRF